jgi:hypothetical protein
MLESERKIHNQGKLVELHPVSASACLLSCSSRVQNSFRREDGVYFFLTDKVILSTFANGIGEANIFNSFGYNRGKYFLPPSKSSTMASLSRTLNCFSSKFAMVMGHLF